MHKDDLNRDLEHDDARGAVPEPVPDERRDEHDDDSAHAIQVSRTPETPPVGLYDTEGRGYGSVYGADEIRCDTDGHELAE